MGGSKTPEPITPGEAAQAAMGTAAAGEKMSVANQGVDQYGNLLNTIALGPSAMQAQQALAGRAALQGAQQQMDVQSRVDPQAYAQRQMRMNFVNQRLGQLLNTNPNISYNSPASTYAVPGTADLPDLQQLRDNAAVVASNLSIGSVNRAGADPTLVGPGKTAQLPYATPTSYLSK